MHAENGGRVRPTVRQGFPWRIFEASDAGRLKLNPACNVSSVCQVSCKKCAR